MYVREFLFSAASQAKNGLELLIKREKTRLILLRAYVSHQGQEHI